MFKGKTGNSLAVQWLGLGTFTAEGTGSVLGGGTKIPASRVAQPKNKNNFFFWKELLGKPVPKIGQVKFGV